MFYVYEAAADPRATDVLIGKYASRKTAEKVATQVRGGYVEDTLNLISEDELREMRASAARANNYGYW